MPSVLQEARTKYFNEVLKKYRVTSPQKLNVTKRKQFYKEYQVGWQKRRLKVKDPEKLQVKYTNQYLKQVKRRMYVSKGKLESGMLCEFRYTTVNEKNQKNPPKKYIVLILHPNWHKYLHCLRIDYVKPMYLRRLIKEVGLIDSTVIPKAQRLNTKQLLLEQTQSRKFYLKKLKPFMQQKWNMSYRTFKWDRLLYANLYHFDFDNF